MRILRIEKRGIEGDTPLCYIHSDVNLQSLVDGTALPIHFSFPGEPINREYPFLNIVIEHEESIKEGFFLSINKGECVLRCSSLSDRRLDVVVHGFVNISSKYVVWRPLNGAVLTVSDKASCGQRVDTAGPALMSLLQAHGVEVKHKKTVADEKKGIQQTLTEWVTGDSLQIILTTGGTGLSARDVTPESLIELGGRVVPGIGELMRYSGHHATPMSYLSRSVAVVWHSTLIVAFPGSEKGVRECFQAISPILRHAVGTINGWESECASHRHSK